MGQFPQRRLQQPAMSASWECSVFSIQCSVANSVRLSWLPAEPSRLLTCNRRRRGAKSATPMCLCRTAIFGLGFCFFSGVFLGERACAAGADDSNGWKKLFNGKDLDGWHVVIGNAARPDTNHLVQIHDGMIHMYKDVEQGSPQPAGYIVTDKEYSNYHLKLEYKWGEKRFGGRAEARRDAGILYHVVGKDGVWPKSVECQIQENDVGDIFTVNTRLTAQ